jgi:hypothetical protein
MPAGWNAHSLLDYIATTQPPFHALIDTGALITGMSNKGVAQYLLEAGLPNMKGVVYLDELDRQMVLLRKGLKVVKLAESGLAWNERFTFYDQVHTTGMDIKQAVDACAAVTLGKDMVFRDYAQGTFRMRGIGKGQTLCLLVVPEIEDRIRVQVSIGAGVSTQSVVASSANPKQYLQDVVSWLTINSMRVDGIQFSLLCEQSVSNIWRKRAFATLLNDYNNVDKANCPPELETSLQVFMYLNSYFYMFIFYAFVYTIKFGYTYNPTFIILNPPPLNLFTGVQRAYRFRNRELGSFIQTIQ